MCGNEFYRLDRISMPSLSKKITPPVDFPGGAWFQRGW
jgi:hypothetical protein